MSTCLTLDSGKEDRYHSTAIETDAHLHRYMVYIALGLQYVDNVSLARPHETMKVNFKSLLSKEELWKL